MSGGSLPWRQLSWRDKATVAAFACILPVISLSLRVLGYKRTHALLDRLSTHPTHTRRTPGQWLELGHHWAHLARLGARWTPANTSCLRQALLVRTLLRRHGFDPQIQFGVDRHGGSVDMHAWVELDGHPLGQTGLRHKPFRKTQ